MPAPVDPERGRAASQEGLPRVVILGGGFGGLWAARGFAGRPVRVTVVDRRNHHLFQPLLYQVATAALNPSDIATPIRRILRDQHNVEVLLADAVAVDVPHRRVVLADGEVPYDYLIVATGATHSYFGHDQWEAHAPGLKTVEDALQIRRRILLAFEAAEREEDPERRREWLTFVVVGGGPTGVELAGALAEISRHVLKSDFRRIDPRDAKIVLLEAGPRVLATYPPDLSAKAEAQLRRLGAEVYTRTTVTGIDEHGVAMAGERIRARTALWAAGVAASPLARSLGVSLDRAGRVLVEPDLSVPGSPEVFVVGDLAALQQDGKWLPGVAQVAMQGGRHAARMVMRRAAGQPTSPFRYLDKGSIATIGRAAAVAQIGRLKVSGFLAWWIWLFIHILYLIGFRNRLLVLIEWAWVYVTWERGARLITGEVDGLLEEPPPRTTSMPSIDSRSSPGEPASRPVV